MKVNKFKKTSKNKYKIIFENGEELTLYTDTIVKHNLLYKKEIDNSLLKLINKDNYYFGIYNESLNYVNSRMRSKKEIFNYLINKGYKEEYVYDNIRKLESLNLINDYIYAKSYINDKLNLSNDGPIKMKTYLESNNIDLKVIDELLCNISDDILIDRVKKIVDKELKINSKTPKNKLKNKIMIRCVNLGYDIDIINRVMSNVVYCSNSDINKDYKKLYDKYNKKYDEYKLKNFIKSKLYSKGYSLEEINSLDV